MGQKVNPVGLRLGINRTWDSRWFARKEYGSLLLDDLGLRKFLGKRLSQAGLSRIIIERAAKRTRITLHSARPGVVIGKKGADIEKLRTDIAKVTDSEVSLNIVEIRKPEIDAKLIADGIARMEWYREGRVPLHTLRADVDFGYGTAKTTYGVCGVKVWVFKGEILAHDPMAQDKRLNEGQPASHERGRREALG